MIRFAFTVGIFGFAGSALAQGFLQGSSLQSTPLISSVAGATVTSATVTAALGYKANLLDYGAKCDGVTDDSMVITTVAALNTRVAIPAGLVCVGYSIAQNAVSGVFTGSGQIKTSDGNLRGPIISQMTAAPLRYGNLSGGVVTGYNGDLSHVLFAVEQRITGSATLGTPAAGAYQTAPETSAFFEQMYNASGSSGSATTGRTGVAHRYMLTTQAGGGDAYSIYAQCNAAGSTATSAVYLPACVLLGGQVSAQGQGSYLNPLEVHLLDNGYDVSGVGTVNTMVRTVGSTHGLGNYWEGVIVQNQGSYPIDSGFQLQGPASIGLDLVTTSLGTNEAAITLGAGQRIYGAATNTNSLALSYATVPGTAWFDYTAANGWEQYTGSALVFSIGGTNNDAILGGNNTMAGQNSLAQGAYNSIGSAAQYSAAIGGANVVTAPYSFVHGQLASDHGNAGANCQSTGQFAAAGDAQGCLYVFRGSTTSTAARRLTTDGNGMAAVGNCLSLPSPGYTVGMTIHVVARDLTSASTLADWNVTQGYLNRDATNGMTYAGATPTQLSTGAGSTAALAIAADTPNACLSLTFTAPNADTWHVVATVRTTEVQ